jgi:hypothetical protein
VLQTLSDPGTMPAEHIVDMSSTIFKCLKESTRCSAALLDQFKELQGYAVTLKLLLHFDHTHIAKSVMVRYESSIALITPSSLIALSLPRAETVPRSSDGLCVRGHACLEQQVVESEAARCSRAHSELESSRQFHADDGHARD